MKYILCLYMQFEEVYGARTVLPALVLKWGKVGLCMAGLSSMRCSTLFERERGIDRDILVGCSRVLRRNRVEILQVSNLH